MIKMHLCDRRKAKVRNSHRNRFIRPPVVTHVCESARDDRVHCCVGISAPDVTISITTSSTRQCSRRA
jgi:hypothetical protein